ncbi:MAG: hypothetical protein KJ879_02310 [Nanoarchaeota archaeon]|nr:hypothetical protein [Nanoarchaeota archaeon]
MQKGVSISKKGLKGRGLGEWLAIKDLADYFHVPPKEVLDEINDLGNLANGVFQGGGQVYVEPLEGVRENEVVLSPIRTVESLVNLGLIAYASWKDGSNYELRIYDGRKEWRWYPKKHISREEKVFQLAEKAT